MSAPRLHAAQERLVRRRGKTALVALALALVLPATAHALPACPANIDRTTPDADLVDNGDKTITHLRTGLTWKQCSEGLSGANCLTGVHSYLTFAAAQAAAVSANSSNFAGHNDWRVPNYKELQSIVEYGCEGTSINWTRFPNTMAGQYWTSTTWQYTPSQAWAVEFNSGASMISAKTAAFAVRLVRGGNSFNAFDTASAGAKSASGSSPTGTGTISAAFTGGGAGCGFAYSQFALPSAPLPVGVTLPHGLFSFSTYNCTAGSAISLTVNYPQTLPAGTVLWIYGPTAGNTTPHWYILPATVAGSQVAYTLTDGQTGDEDLAVNGHITNVGGAGTDRIFGSGFE